MVKRLLDLAFEESLEKKIKLENELVWEKIKDNHEEIDINNH